MKSVDDGNRTLRTTDNQSADSTVDEVALLRRYASSRVREIPKRAVAVEALARRVSVGACAPESPVAEALRVLAEEVAA